MSRWSVGRAICEAGRRLAERGLIAGAEGNISARCGGTLLVTPAGRSKADLAPADLVEVDARGHPLGRGVPSSELALHLVVLAERHDVGAVVHAHPPTATGFAAAGLAMDGDELPELLAQFGGVPLVPYGMPGSRELAERVRPFVAGPQALLLANHGAVTFGSSVEEAEERMESVEQGARILLTARLLGGARHLPPAEVEKLRTAWRKA